MLQMMSKEGRRGGPRRIGEGKRMTGGNTKQKKEGQIEGERRKGKIDRRQLLVELREEKDKEKQSNETIKNKD